MTDNRIGTCREDGSIEAMPEFNILGGRFDQPGSIHNLDTRHFVVLPAGYTDDTGALAQLREQWAAMKAEPAPDVAVGEVPAETGDEPASRKRK